MADYFVRTSGGNDSNGGTSVADGWATIERALDTGQANHARPGDTVFLCTMVTGEKFVLTSTIVFDIAGTDETGYPDQGPIIWTGANSVGDDDGTTAVLTAMYLPSGLGVSITEERQVFRYIQVEDNPNDGGWLVNAPATSFFRTASVGNTGNGFDITSAGLDLVFVEAFARDNTANGFNSAVTARRIWCYACVARDQGNCGFRSPAIGCVNCLSYGNVNTGFDVLWVVNCTSHNNLEGIRLNVDGTNATAHCIVNCLLSENGTGIIGNNEPALLLSNAFFNNTLDVHASVRKTDVLEVDSVALSASPFVDTSSNNFALNNHPDGGQLCRHAGKPTSFIGIKTRSSVDIGASFPKLDMAIGG